MNNNEQDYLPFSFILRLEFKLELIYIKKAESNLDGISSVFHNKFLQSKF
jgi:hypothetical protein